MKAKRNSVMRMENLINNDRMKNSEGFVDLLTGDIDRVLRDYFDYKEYPTVTVYKNGNAFAVRVELTAEGVRAFSSIPQER